ncbi:DUF5331 domain-containing protein [Nostoc sp. UHCC 0302]|uniref:DUF5331 domain-containing protein n=1 Tax=Nostoc sp. UHCC 0302 TaxID=3134896 RepID=UPI00311C9C59
MNIQELRQSLKLKWLSYYEQNSSWLDKIQIWATYDGVRRPSSGLIVTTLSVLEPQFEQLLPFLLELNNNPDKIVAALGLNFNPGEELRLIKSEHSTVANQVESESTQDKSFQKELVPSVAIATQVTRQSAVKTLDTPKLAYQPVSSLTATAEVSDTPKPGLLVAVATKTSPGYPQKMPNSTKPDSGLVHQNKPVRSLVINTDVKSNGNNMRLALPLSFGRLPMGASLVITTQVNSKAKTVPSSVLTSEISREHKPLNTQPQDIKSKVKLSHSTNARSLASWVDEFCQGTKGEREDNIFI